MDVFSHALWTNLLYYPSYKSRLRDRLWAVFFGVMPDLISFTPLTVYLFFTGNRFFPASAVVMHHPLFIYATESYNFTHSLVVFALVFFIVTVIRRGKVWWPLLGWAFHISLDIFTHPDFFSTPFLYPLSNFKNHYGLSWAEPHFLAVDWIVLICIYAYLFYDWRKKKAVAHGV